MTERVRDQLTFPVNVPTYDVSEIAHIQNLGGGHGKFWLAGTAPTTHGSSIISQRLVKVALIWPMLALPRAIRMSEAAAASFALLTPDDFIGTPKGNG